jgi:hypothetical protein
MMNTALFMNLIDRYNAVAYTHNYIWGFEFKGNIYMAITDSSYMPHICTLDKASRGAGYALRFSPNAQQKIALMPKAEVICSKKFFEEICADSKYNKGEIFEKMVTEKYGQTWEKDTIPFTKAGDIEIDGIPYQIKFQKATFCNERTIASLEK